jgi:hypothetical protein
MIIQTNTGMREITIPEEWEVVTKLPIKDQDRYLVGGRHNYGLLKPMWLYFSDEMLKDVTSIELALVIRKVLETS